MGPPETTRFEYPGEDSSWRAEWRHFLDCLLGRATPLGGLQDALAALAVVDQAYALGGRRTRPVAKRG
jgi:predicted dehydrogenase